MSLRHSTIFRSLKHCNARGAGRDLGRNTTGIAPAPAVRRSRIAPLAAPDLDRRALSETAKDRVGDPVRLQARSRFRPTHPAATMSSGAPVREVGLSLGLPVLFEHLVVDQCSHHSDMPGINCPRLGGMLPAILFRRQFARVDFAKRMWLGVRACLQPDRSRNEFAFQSRRVLVSL